MTATANPPPARARTTPPAHEFSDQANRVRDDVTALRSAAQCALRDCAAILQERLTQHPYATVAVAAGVGYVLGGGLPLPLVRAALAIGGRLAVERALVQLVQPTATQTIPR